MSAVTMRMRGVRVIVPATKGRAAGAKMILELLEWARDIESVSHAAAVEHLLCLVRLERIHEVAKLDGAKKRKGRAPDVERQLACVGRAPRAVRRPARTASWPRGRADTRWGPGGAMRGRAG